MSYNPELDHEAKRLSPSTGGRPIKTPLIISALGCVLIAYLLLAIPAPADGTGAAVNGLRLTLKTDRRFVRLGDTVTLTTTLHNERSAELSLHLGITNDWDIEGLGLRRIIDPDCTGAGLEHVVRADCTQQGPMISFAFSLTGLVAHIQPVAAGQSFSVTTQLTLGRLRGGNYVLATATGRPLLEVPRQGMICLRRIYDAKEKSLASDFPDLWIGLLRSNDVWLTIVSAE